MANYYENQALLDSEIERMLKELSTHAPGTDGYKTVAEQLKTLEELRQEQQKIDADAKKQKADIIVGASSLGVTLLTAVGYIVRDWSMFSAGLKFEETGSIQSLMSRSIASRIFKK